MVESFLDQLGIVEPDDDELELAALLEAAAIQENVDFDVGEAQLLAILLNRSSPAMATGDKRAVIAMHRLGIPEAFGRVICLEQLLVIILEGWVADELRVNVCAEPSADRAISHCFACTSIGTTATNPDSIELGLQSYVADIRSKSGPVLMLDGTVRTLAT